MLLNSETVQLIRSNANRLAASVRSKDDLAELATASNLEQVSLAIENILTNTQMFFDDEIFDNLSETGWRSLKASLMIYTCNTLNRRAFEAREISQVKESTRELEGASQA